MNDTQERLTNAVRWLVNRCAVLSEEAEDPIPLVCEELGIDHKQVASVPPCDAGEVFAIARYGAAVMESGGKDFEAFCGLMNELSVIYTGALLIGVALGQEVGDGVES